MNHRMSGFPVLYCLLRFAQIHAHWSPGHYLIISSSAVPFLLAFNLSQQKVFSNGSAHHNRWPKYWSLSFSISPSNEYSGLISFRIDWFDLLAVRRTLSSFLQHHNSKASILQCPAFFTTQLSHPYVSTGKSIPLTMWTFVSKVMSLLFYFSIFVFDSVFLFLLTLNFFFFNLILRYSPLTMLP